MAGLQDLDLGDIRALALQNVKDDSDTQFWTNAQLNMWINIGLQRFMAVHSDGVEDSDYSQTTVAGQRWLLLPWGFKRFRSGGVRVNGVTLRYYSSAGQNMDYFGNTQGQPQYYAIHAGKLLLDPIPSTAWAVQLDFWRDPYNLVNDLDRPDLPNRYRSYLADFCEYMMLKADVGTLKKAEMVKESFDEGVAQYHKESNKKTRDESTITDQAGYLPGPWDFWC